MDPACIVTTVLGFLLIYLIYYFFLKTSNYWEERGVPTIKSVPLWSTIKALLFSNKSFIDYVTDVYNMFEGHKYGGYLLFFKPCLLVRDPELINQILIKDFSYFQDRNPPLDETVELMNGAISTVTGDRWRILRHKLTPTFTSGKMKMMFSQIKECSDEFVTFIRKNKGKDLETRDFLFKFMINVIGSIAFGVNVDAFNEDNKENEFLENSRKFFTPSMTLQLKMMLFMAMPKVKDFFRIKLIDSGVDEFFYKLTEDLIKHRTQNNVRRNDFLQLMLDQRDKENNLFSSENENLLDKANEDEEADDIELLEHLKNVKYDKNAKVFTEQSIAAQSFIFISGGSETTATVLSFTLHELAINQDIQRRLQAEIDNVLSSQEFSYDAIKKMTYMEQVINEVLRIRPPSSLVTRICTEDYKFPEGNFILTKDTPVQIPVRAIHMDPQYFPDPEKFNPDRFENMDQIPKGVFFPFGGGPRICIAMRLAMLEMKIFLATVLSTHNVVTSKKTKLPLKMNKTSVLQHVVGGLWVRFEERKKSL